MSMKTQNQVYEFVPTSKKKRNWEQLFDFLCVFAIVTYVCPMSSHGTPQREKSTSWQTRSTNTRSTLTIIFRNPEGLPRARNPEPGEF